MHDRTSRGVATSGGARRRVSALSALALVVLGLGAVATTTAAGAAKPGKLKLGAVAPVQQGVPASTAKSLLGKVAESDPSLLARTDTAPLDVVVKLDYDSVASYAGGIAGLPATSPKATGRKLRQNRAAVAAYTSFLAGLEAEIVARIKQRVPEAEVGQSFRNVYGGVALTLPANKAKEVAALKGVVAVQKDALNQPLTDATPAFLGATSVWPSLGGPTKAGEGVLVGVLDTGVWPEHPSWADNGLAPPPGGPFECNFGTSGQPDDKAFACNNKLVGAYAFVDTYLANLEPLEGEFCNAAGTACSARDADGHGTHTATTAAGGPVANATLLGVDRGSISGMAPGAHVIAYRVCLDQGCFSTDSVAAVNQAIVDGVDVLNFSISGGSSAYTDPVELAFLEAYEAGILVNASAGNSGPGAGTANHAGPWTNTVAASTSDRHFFSTLRLAAAGGGTLSLQGVTVTQGVPPTDVVLASSLSGYDGRCLVPAPPLAFAAKVVVCARGVNARVDKGFNVLSGGAAGMILYNTAIQQLNSDSHWLPAIHVEGPSAAGSGGDAEKLLAFLSANTGVTATWGPGMATRVRGDVIASFSSRGPLGDFLKPDVTAPGLQILAGMTPDPWEGNITAGPPGQLYQAIAGTSMSSPHAAGLAALVKDAHPDWTPGQIKSALMTSSVQDVLKEDGATPADPFDTGAGAIRANRAVSPTVTFDVPASDYFGSAGDPLGRINLNLPSVYAETMSGEVTTWRTLKNVSGSFQRLEISTEEPAGVDIIVRSAWRGARSLFPSRDRFLNVPADAEKTLQITIKAPQLADGGPYFGRITLDPVGDATEAVLPVAFFKKQGAVTLEHSCIPTTFPRSQRTTCTVKAQNTASAPAETKLDVTPTLPLLTANVTPPARPRAIFGATWSGTLSPALAPSVDAIDPGGSPAGYLPLRLFGVPPVQGFGDETIANFGVPAFSYGDETYTRLGIVSNGYLVIGGGTAEDVDFNAQTLPDPARPNNVLAPYWTDLDPGSGGQIRIGTLTDGADTWIVVDYEKVVLFGTSTQRSFQVWIGVQGDANPGEDVTLTFGPEMGAGDPTAGLTVGAENRDGSSGKQLPGVPAANSDYTVVLGSPTPGGSVSFSYQAFSFLPGSYVTTASLESSVTVGKTQVAVPLTITR